MELLTPGVGLIFWQTVIFLSLFFLLSKFAWKPILNSLRIREESIEEALSSAEEARNQLENLKADNEKLLEEARQEKDMILKQAKQTANAIHDEAKAEAVKTAERMIADAKAIIENEKQAALAEVKNQVSELSLAITEKVLRRQLEDKKEQEKLISEFVKDLNVN